jgi:hypothetical protein
VKIGSVVSLELMAALKTRAAQFAGKTLSAAIVANKNAQFWYWIQWGTAGRQDPNAPAKTSHAGSYSIDPVQALVLRWPSAVAGGFVYSMHVDHPGIRPRLFVTKVMNEIWTKARKDFLSVHDGTLAEIEDTLMNETMPFAVEQVVASLASEASGVRADGRLDGQSASEVFADNITIENRS